MNTEPVSFHELHPADHRTVGRVDLIDFHFPTVALEGESRRYSRMLSSFSYGKVKAYFISRGPRQDRPGQE